MAPTQACLQSRHGARPNHVLMWGLLAAGLVYGRYAGRSPFECIHYGLDRRIVRILQTGSDRPRP